VEGRLCARKQEQHEGLREGDAAVLHLRERDAESGGLPCCIFRSKKKERRRELVLGGVRKHGSMREPQKKHGSMRPCFRETVT
jgi:hypothetical protein